MNNIGIDAQEIFDNHLILSEIYNTRPEFGGRVTNTVSPKFPKNLYISGGMIARINDDNIIQKSFALVDVGYKKCTIMHLYMADQNLRTFKIGKFTSDLVFSNNPEKDIHINGEYLTSRCGAWLESIDLKFDTRKKKLHKIRHDKNFYENRFKSWCNNRNIYNVDDITLEDELMFEMENKQ